MLVAVIWGISITSDVPRYVKWHIFPQCLALLLHRTLYLTQLWEIFMWILVHEGQQWISKWAVPTAWCLHISLQHRHAWLTGVCKVPKELAIVSFCFPVHVRSTAQAVGWGWWSIPPPLNWTCFYGKPRSHKLNYIQECLQLNFSC